MLGAQELHTVFQLETLAGEASRAPLANTVHPFNPVHKGRDAWERQEPAGAPCPAQQQLTHHLMLHLQWNHHQTFKQLWMLIMENKPTNLQQPQSSVCFPKLYPKHEKPFPSWQHTALGRYRCKTHPQRDLLIFHLCSLQLSHDWPACAQHHTGVALRFMEAEGSSVSPWKE